MGENVWEPDLEAFEKERERGKETIDAFMEPGQSSRNRKSPSYHNNQAMQQQQQDYVKPISMETRYNIVFSKSVNDRFASFRGRANLTGELDEEEEEDEEEMEEECNEEEELSEMELFSGLESGDATIDDEEVSQQGKKRKRINNGSRKKVVPKKRVKFDRATRCECLFCSHGNAQLDGIEAPHIKKLFDIVRLNNGNRDNLETAWEACLYYKEEVYDGSEDMPVLTPEMVLDHLEGMHSINAGLYLAEMIRKETKLLFLLGESMCLEDGTYDFKVLAEYRKSQKILNEYYKMKPDSLAFNQENNEEDMKRLASSIYIQPKFGRTPTRSNAKKSSPPKQNTPTPTAGGGGGGGEKRHTTTF